MKRFCGVYTSKSDVPLRIRKNKTSSSSSHCNSNAMLLLASLVHRILISHDV